MKYISQTFLVAILALISTQSFSQVSLSTLQKLALLNGNNVYTFSTEVKEILQPQKFKSIGGGKWIKSTSSNGKELITIMITYDGNMISYEVNNMPNSKSTIQSIKKLGNFAFNNEEDLKSHFRNTDKKLSYDVLYSKDYLRCVISIFPYNEPPKEKKQKIDTTLLTENDLLNCLTNYKLGISKLVNKGYKSISTKWTLGNVEGKLLAGKSNDTIAIFGNTDIKLKCINCTNIFNSLNTQIGITTDKKDEDAKQHSIFQKYKEEKVDIGGYVITEPAKEAREIVKGHYIYYLEIVELNTNQKQYTITIGDLNTGENKE